MSEQCRAQPMGGGQCQLDAGHEGKHMRSFPTGRVFHWDDASQSRLADEHGSRFD